MEQQRRPVATSQHIPTPDNIRNKIPSKNPKEKTAEQVDRHLNCRPDKTRSSSNGGENPVERNRRREVGGRCHVVPGGQKGRQRTESEREGRAGKLHVTQYSLIPTPTPIAAGSSGSKSNHGQCSDEHRPKEFRPLNPYSLKV